MKAASALLLLGAGTIAQAGATIEIDPRYESFASPAAFERELERRHSAAQARCARLPAGERGNNRVDGLKRDTEERLGYFEVLDLRAEAPHLVMPGSQTEYFTCRGNRLEHRISLGDKPGS